MDLKTYLDQNDIRQHVFAASIGCNQANVSRWSSGRSVPPSAKIAAIEIATQGAVTFRDWFAPEQPGANSPKPPAEA